MPALVDGRPTTSLEEARTMVCSVFFPHLTDLDMIKVSELPSERDRNFLITIDDVQYLLKLFNVHTRRSEVTFIHSVLHSLSQSLPLTVSVPAPLPPRNNAIDALALYTFLPGVPLGDYSPIDDNLLHALGAAFAEVDRSLIQASLPRLDGERKEDFEWDLSKAFKTIRRLSGCIKDVKNRQLVQDYASEFQYLEEMLVEGSDSILGKWSWIHNDGNDFNIIVMDGRNDPPKIGVIDFGDMIRGPKIIELAVLLAYLWINLFQDEFEKDHEEIPHYDYLLQNFWKSIQTVRGYHQILGLSKDEIEVLLPLTILRLCVSVSVSSHHQNLIPDDPYITISQRGAWNVLWKMNFLMKNSLFKGFLSLVLLSSCSFDLDLSAGEKSEMKGLNEQFLVFQGVSEDFERIRSQKDILCFSKFMSVNVEFPQRRTLRDVLYESQSVYICSKLEKIIREEKASSELRLQFPMDAKVLISTDRVLVLLCMDKLFVFQFNSKRADLPPEGTSIQHGSYICLEEDMRIWAMSGQLRSYNLNFSSLPEKVPPSQREFWKKLVLNPLELIFPNYNTVMMENDDAETIQRLRSCTLLGNLSLSYSPKPLYIIQGIGQYLFDNFGQAYLDLVNNVAHVGHCNSDVIEAGYKQMILLNTNTRYLHQSIVKLSTKLLSTLPNSLEICCFVCSGSEANELAMRLSMIYSKSQNFVVMDSGYHGNTTGLIGISGYKFLGKGGNGVPPSNVTVLPTPNLFRGKFKTEEEYIEDARRTIGSLESVAAFFCESILSCGGQIPLPPNYLKEIYSMVRSKGGVCVADEVQVGFGRVGSHMWGFQLYGESICPDIVTMGKPMGNGHPIGCVAIRREVAQAFADNGMEYFNTFGGNPVSCSIALQVLKVVEDLQLQENALKTGNLIKNGLKEMQKKFPVIADVRGEGLFLGLEFLGFSHDPVFRGAQIASYVVKRLKELYILASTDGPDHNVIKLKPPLVITDSDVRLFLEAMEKILSEFYCRN